MTAEQFRATMAELVWKHVDLIRRLDAESDQVTAQSTVSRWAQGRHPVPAGVAAYLRLALRIRRLGI